MVLFQFHRCSSLLGVALWFSVLYDEPMTHSKPRYGKCEWCGARHRTLTKALECVPEWKATATLERHAGGTIATTTYRRDAEMPSGWAVAR